MEIKKEHKKVLRENLEQRFYTYLCYDQKAHKKFEDPSSKNAQYWGRVKQDAVRMADLVIRELDFMYGELLLLTTERGYVLLPWRILKTKPNSTLAIKYEPML